MRPGSAQTGSLFFMLNEHGDIDHIVPIIWRCAQEGSRCLIFFPMNYDWRHDYRLLFLSKCANVEICELWGAHLPTIAGKLYRRLRYGRGFARRFLKKHRVRACVTQWSVIGKDLMGRFLAATRVLNIRWFAVPHGCNVHLNYDKNDAARQKFKRVGRWLDQTALNVCDHFIVDSPYNKQFSIEGGIHPDKCHAWGSARFSLEWVVKNLEICPAFAPLKDASNKRRVLFFMPHWRNNVDQSATTRLLERLARLSSVYLVTRDHTRGNGSLPADWRDRLNGYPNVEASVEIPSPALVDWADVVISFGTSIGVEAICQNKALINPKYLHGNTTIFDKTGSCLTCGSEDEVIAMLETTPPIDEDSRRELLKEVVYGGREPFDVLGFYAAEIMGNAEPARSQSHGTPKGIRG